MSELSSINIQNPSRPLQYAPLGKVLGAAQTGNKQLTQINYTQLGNSTLPPTGPAVQLSDPFGKTDITLTPQEFAILGRYASMSFIKKTGAYKYDIISEGRKTLPDFIYLKESNKILWKRDDGWHLYNNIEKTEFNADGTINRFKQNRDGQDKIAGSAYELISADADLSSYAVKEGFLDPAKPALFTETEATPLLNIAEQKDIWLSLEKAKPALKDKYQLPASRENCVRLAMARFGWEIIKNTFSAESLAVPDKINRIMDCWQTTQSARTGAILSFESAYDNKVLELLGQLNKNAGNILATLAQAEASIQEAIDAVRAANTDEQQQALAAARAKIDRAVQAAREKISDGTFTEQLAALDATARQVKDELLFLETVSNINQSSSEKAVDTIVKKYADNFSPTRPVYKEEEVSNAARRKKAELQTQELRARATALSSRQKEIQTVIDEMQKTIIEQWQKYSNAATFTVLLQCLQEIANRLSATRKKLSNLGLSTIEQKTEMGKVSPDKIFELFDLMDIAEKWESGEARLTETQRTQRNDLLQLIQKSFD